MIKTSQKQFHESGFFRSVRFLWIGLLFASLVSITRAESLTVQTDTPQITSASAKGTTSGLEKTGKIEKDAVRFDNLSPGEGYDLSIKQKDGKILRCIDLSWYAPLPASPDKPEPITDEDKKAIEQIVTEIKAFTNKNTIVQLSGNAGRAVALVELIRDTDWHDRKGQEVLWRVEVWYFEYQAGGWAKVQQQNRVIERERIANPEALEAKRKPFIWRGFETGLRIVKGADATVTIGKE